MRTRPLALAVLALLGGFLFSRCHAPRGPLPEGPLLGTGEHRYVWEAGWLQWPEDEPLGNTHGGFAFDGKGRIWFCTDASPAIACVDPSGEVIARWGEDLQGGAHALCLAEVDGKESLWIAHHTSGQVYRYDLDGTRTGAWGLPEQSGVYADAPNRFRPTAVAVRPDGSFFVADGYGLSYVHRYDADGNWVASFGGRGAEPGQFTTPHGLLWDAEDEVLVVADRENHRLQCVREDGSVVRVLEGMFRRPCSVQRRGDDYVVADLAGRVTVVSVDGQRVVQLGDQPNPDLRARNGIDRPFWEDGIFLAPHGAGWDRDGNLYVQDWNRHGRVNRLVRL